MSDTKLTYRPDVDGLRAVAVLSVVFCHAGFNCPGGFIGVDVFFVISGFLIAGLILKELRKGTFTLSNFWERRARRILPALAVVVAATAIGAWFILMPADFAAFGKSLVGLALLGSNVQFWKAIDYFDSAAEEKPLLHTWSLSVEEQFYLFVPVFLLLLSKRGFLSRAFVLLALMALASLGLSVYWTKLHPTTNFYLLPTRAWELFAGALLAFAPPCGISKKRWAIEFIALLGMALILVPCFIYDATTPFPGLTAVPPVLGSVLLIWVGSTPSGFSWIGKLLASKPVVFVGLISYSLYLWHWPLFAFTRYLSLEHPGAAMWWGLIIASVILATLSWWFVERPFRQRTVLANRRTLFGTSFATLAIMFCAGMVMFATKGFESRIGPKTRLLAETGTFDQSYVHEIFPEDVPAKLVRLGDTNLTGSILVWGDSHAMATLPVIEAVCREQGVGAVAATHAATPPVLGWFSRNQWGLNERSLPFNAAVMEYVKTNNIRAVILISFWSMHSEIPEFQTAFLRTVQELQAAKVQTYLMRDVPIYKFNVQKAMVRYSYRQRDLAEFGRTAAERQAEDKMPPEFVEKLEAAGVRFLNPTELLLARSGTENFLPYDDNGSFYYDGNHLSTYGSMALKPLFEPIFREFGARKLAEHEPAAN